MKFVISDRLNSLKNSDQINEVITAELSHPICYQEESFLFVKGIITHKSS